MKNRGAILGYFPSKAGAIVGRYWRSKEGIWSTFKIAKDRTGYWTLKGWRKR